MEPRVRVAFVDDDGAALTYLRRGMLAMLDEWEMGFFASGADLLARLASESFDVVVTDMRMPDMDGAELLDRIGELYPDMVRVIITGSEDSASVFRTVGPAHIYLVKPCEPLALKLAIRSRLTLRSLIGGAEMRRFLDGIAKLPAAPKLFLDLVAELRSPASSVGTVANIIKQDVAMTVELLKLTNSSYFSAPSRVSAPLQAVRIIGLEIVQTLVLQLGIFLQFQGSEEMRRHIEAINAYSLALGDLAERVAQAAGEPDSVAKAAHCAALLSALGSLVLLSERGADYLALLAEADADLSLHQVERQHFGADHTLIGAYLLGLWGFSDIIVEAVTFCGHPSDCINCTNPVLTALHVARAVGPPFPLLPRAKAKALVMDQAYMADFERVRSTSNWLRAASLIPTESA